MASLNLSTNGPSISKSYQSVVNSRPPAGAAAQSPTYGQWAVFSVSAPLANAFQQENSGKESVLKVQSSGEGELTDLIDEFSDGRIQFAFAKVKDPNTTLPKSVLIGWCGEGVPERTKGYFTSHLAAVSKTLQGYHVQVTARSDRDLTPDSIVQKVSEASGSKYSGGSSVTTNGPPPPMSSKPAFTPTRSSAGAGGYNPLASSRARPDITKKTNVDSDGWGEDAPPVTRTELEKVPSAYQPTEVNLRDGNTQQLGSTRHEENPADTTTLDSGDVVKGGYQPVGKVDIAALRRQAQQGNDDRPTIVKGAYEPVGKVDIAAIRARAQGPASAERPPVQQTEQTENKPVAERSSSFNTSERLTSLPKPKVGNRFGAGAGSFAGTKAPTPGGPGLDSKPTPAGPPMGVGRTFADQGGKTPAQLWAEKKAREGGQGGTKDGPPSAGPASESSGGQWKSGYQGKSWAPVQTTRTGQSSGSTGDKEDAAEEDSTASFGGVGALRDRFKAVPPTEAPRTAPSPPPLDTSSKPNAGRGMPIPGLPSRPAEESPVESQRLPSPPPQPPQSPTPPTPPGRASGSPIRIAMPISRGHDEQEEEHSRDEPDSPPPAMPTRSIAQAVPKEDNLSDEPSGHDPARAAGTAVAAATFGSDAADAAHPGNQQGGKRAVVQYDYEKAEDNEIELKEGEHVTNIDMIDDNWWMGENIRGETGLFPSNYVELVDDDDGPSGGPATHHQDTKAASPPAAVPEQSQEGATATALYDYEAAEDNELSFPENAKITGIEFPDEDWWSGEYRGRQGLFPANYVQLDE